ncbi:MAG: hypothetical protein U0174_06285 [Polyangiaceae bacterium]
MRRLLVLTLLSSLAACIGSTGGGRISFVATAAGPKDAIAGSPLTFQTRSGFSVSLTSAKVHVQAVYLDRRDRTRPERETGCYSAEAFVGELRTSIDVDLTDPRPKAFALAGDALTGAVNSVDVWLGEGAIDAFTRASARQVVLHATGTATREGTAIPFAADFRIDTNRAKAPDSAALPGSNPICLQRIVSKIPANITIEGPGSLSMRIDPRPVFDDVDFAEVPKESDAPLLFRFPDNDQNGASNTLMNGLRKNRGVYSFEWSPQP